MAQWSSPATLVTPGGTITFNDPSGPDGYYHDASQCAGLDAVPTRITVDDKPVTDGGIVFPSFKTARHITLGGQLIVKSAAGSGYAAARNALEFALTAALESIEPVDGDGGPTGTYTWTPEGYGAMSVAVYCEIPPTYPGANAKNYLFGLVAPAPTIST